MGRGTNASRVLVAVLLVALAGCNRGSLDVFDRDLQILPPVELDDSLAYVSATLEKVQFVWWDEHEGAPAIRSFKVGRSPYSALASNDGQRVFVICHGAEEGEVRQSDVEEESLHVVDPGAEEQVVYTLASPFNALSESASGRWAVLFFESMVPGTNPNLLAVVDMTQPPSETNPTIRSIRTLGSIPLGVIIAEDISVSIDGAVVEKDFALILSNSYITLFDLEHLDRSEITVPLVVPEEGIDVVPVEEDVIIFNDPEGTRSRIILRSNNSSDVFSITFLGVGGTDPGANDYRVSLNQLSVDVNPHDAPTDMAPFEDGGRQLVLVTTVTSDSLAVVDPETTMVTTVSVEHPVERSLVFDEGGMAILYTMGQRMGYFIELGDVEAERERSLREFSFGGDLTSFVPVPRKDFVVMMVAGEPSKLFILDLVGQQMDVVNLFGSASTQFLMYPEGDHILISASGAREVWFIQDMDSYVIERIILDHLVRRVWLLSADTPHGKIVLDHDAPEGFLTFMDMDGPKRSNATSLRGFLLHGILGLERDDFTVWGG